MSVGSAKAKGLGQKLRAIVDEKSASRYRLMRFGDGSVNVMSPSMIESLTDFSIFGEEEEKSSQHPYAEETVAPYVGRGGGTEGIILPGIVASGSHGGDDYDAELGGGGGGGGGSNKIMPLPLEKRRIPTKVSSWKKVRALRSEKKLNRPASNCCPVMTPKNKFFNFWDPVIITCLIFTAIVTPVEVAFLRQPEWPFDGLFYINRVVDFTFVIDMLVQFNLAYPVSNSHSSYLITNRWKISKRYVRGTFIIDFISILPYDALPGGVSDLKALRMARLLKLFKLLRVLRAGRIFKRIETSIVIHYGYMKLAKFFFVVIFSAHLMACAFRLVVGIEDNNDSNWILNYFGDERYAKYDDPPWATLYMTAYYWSIMTMTTIGYGDVLPVTVSEIICTTICMMIGTSIYAYIFGNICSILDGMTMRSQTFHNTMDQLNTFMESKYIPKNLRLRLREFYRYKFEQQGSDEWHSLVSEMSPLLQGEVAVQVNGSWLQSIPLLRDCDEKLYTQISLAMASVTYCPMESVIDLHEPPSAMYIVERGVVGGLTRIFTSGMCMGQDCLWQPLDSPRPYSASTLSYANLLSLQRSDIMEVVAFFPKVRKRLARAATRARAQQKILVYTRAFNHFKHALREFTWTDPATPGTTRKGSMMLPLEGMEEAMRFVAEYPPQKELYRVDPLFPAALEGVIQACWSKWSVYQGAASTIQSAFRGSRDRANFMEVYTRAITAVKRLQRGTRKMLFRNRLNASSQIRRSLGSDPNADIRIRLVQLEDQLQKLRSSVDAADSRAKHETQFMIGMIADIHAAVNKDPHSGPLTLRQRFAGHNVIGSGHTPGAVVKHRRGFKGI